MANIANLGVKMGLDTVDFTQALETAKKSLESFKEVAVELISIAAFEEMTKKALEYADTIVKTANANDVTTASVLELSRALEESGGNAENTSAIYSGFTQKMESAALGSEKAQEAFARIGVSLKDLKTLSSQELFEKTISGLANIKDAAERNGLAFQTLGRQIRGTDIVGLNEHLQEAKGTMNQYAASVEQAHELSLKLAKDSKDIGLEFTRSVIPAVDMFYEGLHKLADPVKGLIQLFGIFVDVLAVTFNTAEQGIIQLGDITKTVGFVIADVLRGNIDEAKKDWKGGLDEMSSDYAKYEESLQKLMNPEKAKEKPQGPADRPVTPAGSKQLLQAQDLSKEYERQAAIQFQLLSAKEAETHLTKNQKDYVSEITKVLTEMQKALDNVDKKIATTDPTTAAGQRTITMLKEQKQQIIDTAETYVQKTEDEVLATQAYQQSFTYGWQKAYEQYVENSNNAAMQAQEMFNSITNSMTNALDKFVETGKLNFGDLAKSILNDMLKIELKAQEMKLFQAIGSSIGGSMQEGGMLSGIGSLFGFASGGEPPVGVPSIVGENGPELFVPQTAGTVVPNNKLADVMGGSNQPSVVYNGPYIQQMSAIDTQSATQFLARNQTAVWAANQSAQRSLPQSR